MKVELRNKAIYLRTKKRMSYGAIKECLGVPKSTLSYWLKDYPLSKKEIVALRQKQWKATEASREKYRETRRIQKAQEFQGVLTQEKRNMSKITQEEWYLAGLMLYLGEGAKKKDSSLVLANSDPRIIKFFIWWLQKFLSVSKDELRIQLHLYESMDVPKEQKFWLGYLGLQKQQMYKSSIRKLQKSSFSYGSTYGHGTCGLYVFGVERVRKVMAGIEAMLDSYE